jgi:hypothetical protein
MDCTFCPSKAMAAHAVTLVFTFVTCVVLIFRKPSPFLVPVCVVVGTMAAWLLTRRDTYLPFLGAAAIPSTLLKDRVVPADANVEAIIDVDAADGSRVLYWGARASSIVESNPWRAYDDYSNAGVATVVDKKAVIVFNCPGEYEVRMRGKLDRHVHFRVASSAPGIIGPVQTAFVKCG